MKTALFMLLGLVVGLVVAESFNEDELRDQLNYVSNQRSKRALCGAQQRATQRPVTIRPPQCSMCRCSPFIISKRAVIDPISSKIGIFPSICSPGGYCCRKTGWPSILKGSGSVNAGKSAVDVNSMASSLVSMFGKRASDNDFKKPSVDLVFLIDDSGSISAPQFKVAKEGAATLSQALCPHTFGSAKGSKQVSVVLFSTTARTILTYEQSQRGTSYVENEILNLKQRSGATATSDALKHVREKVLNQPGNRLNDKDTATIVFVVTDGKCNSGCNTLVSEAKKLREAGPGVQVFAFGVGEADCDELEDIRGKDTGRVFGLPDYNFFEKLAIAVKEQMANNSDICMKN